MALLLPQSIFFHIPKTGGTWVRAAAMNAGLALGEVCPELSHNVTKKLTPVFHCPPGRLETGRYFTFAFVRHPLSYYQSYWAHKMRKGKRDYNRFDRQFMADDFHTFIRNVLRGNRGFVSRMYERYVGPGGDWVDFVGKQEHLVDDLVHALRLAGEDFDEERIRTTPPKNQSAALGEYRDQCHFTPELRDAVCEMDCWVLETFGYGTHTVDAYEDITAEAAVAVRPAAVRPAAAGTAAVASIAA